MTDDELSDEDLARIRHGIGSNGHLPGLRDEARLLAEVDRLKALLSVPEDAATVEAVARELSDDEDEWERQQPEARAAIRAINKLRTP